MHIVTKILIVFCAVLSLLLAALTMAYAANANILKQSVLSEQNRRAAAQTALGVAQSEHGAAMADAERKNVALTNAMTAKDSEIATLQAQRTELRSQVQQARSEADSIRNQIAQLGATADTQSKLISNYRDEVTNLRNTMLTAQKREIELLDRINDLSSAREVLEQNARALKEQLEATKLDLQNSQQAQGSVSSGVTNMAGRTTPRELPGPLVRARVTETFKSPAGDDMVVISEGSNRGLKENTLMNVARNGTFVASIVLTTIEPNRAVGKVSTSKGQVQRDDEVLSRLE